MKILFYSLIGCLLIGCYPISMIQRSPINQEYAAYYESFREDSSTLIAAEYTYIIEKTSEGAFVKKTFFPETKQLTHYRTYSDIQRTSLNGKYMHYYDSGAKVHEGYYKNGERSGDWKIFKTDPTDNHLISYGSFVDDKKDGTWTNLDSIGQVTSVFIYQNDLLNGAYTLYDEKGNIKEEGVYRDDILVETSKQEEKENPIHNTMEVVEKMPRFPSPECNNLPDSLRNTCSARRMLEHIYQNIKYPPIARERGVQGTAIIRYVVRKDGTIDEVDCLKCICQPIKDEVLRIVHSMPDWIPGEQRGEPVNVYFNLPIKFRLE